MCVLLCWPHSCLQISRPCACTKCLTSSNPTLPRNLPVSQYYIPGASSYIAKGEGSIDGIVEAVVAQRKEKADKEAAAQQRAQEVAERRGRALEVLEAAGIQWEGRDIFEVVVLADFVYRGALAVRSHGTEPSAVGGVVVEGVCPGWGYASRSKVGVRQAFTS